LGCTVSGRNAVAPELLELLELLLELLELAELADPVELEALPMFTTVPVGATVAAVPRSATVPVAWMPVTSS
jgi:hypothetical protein